jgi:hypothetical protein
MPSIGVMLIVLTVVLILNSCAFFSDGATIDYSRMFAPTFQLFGGGGHSEPWEADTGYKANRTESYSGFPPWSSYDVEIEGSPAPKMEFHHMNDGGTVTCRTVGKVRFCN